MLEACRSFSASLSTFEVNNSRSIEYGAWENVRKTKISTASYLYVIICIGKMAILTPQLDINVIAQGHNKHANSLYCACLLSIQMSITPERYSSLFV